ncbi:PcfJ domain-containing protein [Flavobacterium oreochromis]|uniref:PcfJ domain-containing protein n=1 Tax=Flavobacterium oreochromis TaxID=2906078 RepID=UPI001CE6AA18|nr:PcfJ domain-containing protein [Flavobacterium oreochromis]QYS85431.1 PcfJ domain-containing protein [Flavobacterium oreochromis]
MGKKDCLLHKGFYTKNSVLCMDCGEKFERNFKKRKKIKCPNCQTALNLEESRCFTDKQSVCYATAEIYGRFQVIRNFELTSDHRKGEKVKYTNRELVQYWIDEKGKVTFIGLKHILNSYADSWNSNWEIRLARSTYWCRNNYDTYPFMYHKDSYFQERYTKLGISHNLPKTGLSILEAETEIASRPKVETLIKQNKFELARFIIRDNYKGNLYWSSIKIALKHQYLIKDVTLWVDYLDVLKYFKKDLNNPSIICPDNLKKEHDRLFKKKSEIERKKQRERERKAAIQRQKQLEEAEKRYRDFVSKFTNIKLEKGNITVSVLKDINEFRIEGTFLDHCVFSNEYYLKENSLCLSAKVAGVRTETIELDINTLEIIQSRGKNNKPSPYHTKIINLVKNNLSKIREIINSKLTA